MDLDADFVALDYGMDSTLSRSMGQISSSAGSINERCVTDLSSQIDDLVDSEALRSMTSGSSPPQLDGSAAAIGYASAQANYGSPDMLFRAATLNGGGSNGAGLINPDRARFLAASGVLDSSNDHGRDLIEPTAPESQPKKKTGANDIALGSRRARVASTISRTNGMVPTRSTRGHTSYISGLVAENARDHWDFNSTQPLPWQAPGASHVPAAPKIRDVPTREFGKCKDRDLLDYLARRRVTRGFLAEIDQFLRANPDIATYSPPFIERLNSLPPLDAYLFFVKGYTRPARYIEGLISSAPFVLPPGFQYRAIQYTEDAELDDFFAGFEYRYDILERIDREVYFACIDMQAGRPVSTSLRRLVCYAVFGNPVDAYKWYEYSYQQDYLPHRYIPEHVVLADVPKPGTYTEPEPSVVKPWNTHADVRFRMARAKDEGVDVIDVLLSEFRFALVRKRLRRCEIDDLYVDARRRIDEERENPTNVDIVDMIMDGAVSQQFRAPLAPKAVPRRNNRTALDEAAEDLREQKTLLQRLYAQEETTFTRSKRPADIAAVRTSRGNTERRYVNALVRYKRINNQMRPFEAQDIQSQFTRKKMGNVGPVNKDYLLSLFPRELL